MTDLLESLQGQRNMCGDTELRIDEACFNVVSNCDNIVTLFSQSDECHMCKFLFWATVSAKSNINLVVNTTYPLKVFFKSGDYDVCHTTYRFYEYGEYMWKIQCDSCDSISLVHIPSFPFFPIVALVLTICLVGLIWNVGKCILNSEWLARLRERNLPFSELESDLGSPSSAEGPSLVRSEILPTVRRQRIRVISLDTFRGISVALMIFVNYGGGQYWFFRHSVWNGLTFADLVFPWFLWIMGVSLVISLRSQLRSALRRRQLLFHVLRRGAILVFLGVILNSVGHNKRVSLQELRIPGVLQRIGLTYLFVGIVEALTLKPQGNFHYGRWLVLQDVLDAWLQWFVVAALAAAHVCISLLVPSPNCPKGYLGPGGLDWTLTRDTTYSNCTGGIAGYVDRIIFGEQHIYQHPTCKPIYDTTQPFDPEGLLGTLSSILTVYLGVQAGRILLSYHYTFSRVVRWSVWCLLCGVAAGILCNFSKDDGWIPVNKNLWSVSFVLATASFAFFILATLYFIIDAQHWWSGSPFIYAGANPLLLYIGHEITKNVFPWAWQPVYGTHTEFLAMDVWGCCLWLFIAFVLFKKNIFMSI